MEPDDLLCSRNARSRTPLVGRAQWKITQPPSPERNEQAWKEHTCRSMRAVKDRLDQERGQEPFVGTTRRALHTNGPDPLILQRSQPYGEGGNLVDPRLRATFSPAHPLARRDVPLARARAFRFSSLRPRGSSQTVLHCAHRTSTVSPCAFCEQEGWSGCSSPILLRPRVARAQKIIRPNPPSLVAALLFVFLLVLLVVTVDEDVAALLLVLLVFSFFTGKSRCAECHCHCDCHDGHQHARHHPIPPL